MAKLLETEVRLQCIRITYLGGGIRRVPNAPKKGIFGIPSLYAESETDPSRTLVATEGASIIQMARFLPSVSFEYFTSLRNIIIAVKLWIL